MTNQLTPAELEAFGNLSGLLEVKVAKNENEGFTYRTSGFIRTSQLAKFAQLVQRREGEAPILKGIGKINGDGFKDTTKLGQVVFVWNREKPEPYQPGQYLRVGNATWTASTEQYEFYPATVDEVQALFAQLVAQALEKAAAIVTLMLEPEVDSVEIAQAIRALKDQPVEQVKDAGPWKLSDSGKSLQSDDFNFDVRIDVDGDFGNARPAYMEWLRSLLNGAAPVEQGGDELVGLLPEKKVFLPNALIGDDANKFMEGMVNGFNDCLEQVRQALANRRGGE